MSEAAKRTLRTVLQTAVGLCVLLPTVVDAAGVPDTLPWVAAALAVAAMSPGSWPCPPYRPCCRPGCAPTCPRPGTARC